jgi:hypothetical protein
VLGAIGFAANAKYTQMIWADLRDSPSGPPALILGELDYWIKVGDYEACLFAFRAF